MFGMGTKKLVIVGGGYAGVFAALRAARRVRKRDHRIQVALYTEHDHMVERIRAHEHGASGRPIQIAYRSLLHGTGVQLHLGRVHGVDAAASRFLCEDGWQSADAMVLATGSHTSVPEALALYGKSVEDPTLRRQLAEARKPAHVLVVGGGLSALETATEMRERGFRVSMVFRGSDFAGLHERTRIRLEAWLRTLGIVVHKGTEVRALEPSIATASDAAIEVQTSQGGLRCQYVVLATGFTPSRLGTESDLAVNGAGRIWTKPTLQSETAANVLVAGDLACVRSTSTNVSSMGCKTAIPQGVFAAENAISLLTGAPLQAFRYADALTCVSLGRKQGLVQFLNPNGSPLPHALWGRAAAWIKEAICLSVCAALWGERTGAFGYNWRKSEEVLALPSLQTSPLHTTDDP
jgi:NADH:ubiquinone reductase (H+-translocating)